MNPYNGTLLVNEVIPRLRSMIPHNTAWLNAEDHEELVQDATAMAARLLVSAESKGKTVTAGNVAHYTVLHIRAGRRFHYSGRSDALGSRTQIGGYSRVSSMDDPVGTVEDTTDEPVTLGETLACAGEDPAETAARNLDWQAFIATLDEKALAVLRCLAGEIRLQELANRYGVCRTTVQQWRNRLTELIRAFLGDDVLHQVQRTPHWQEGMRALREQMACRLDRKMAQ